MSESGERMVQIFNERRNGMLKFTIEAETVAGFIKQLEELIEQSNEVIEKLSAVEINHDTQTGTNSITPSAQKAQVGKERDDGTIRNELNSVLEARHLRVTDGKSGSSNVLGCKKEATGQFRKLGPMKFGSGIDVILMTSWTGEKQWDRMILRDICTFVDHYYGIADFEKLSARLSKQVTSSSAISAHDFAKMIDPDRPGKATLDRYNSGLTNKLPDILPGKDKDGGPE